MRMSDIIAERILQLIEESDENMAEIQRNELASIVGCAPSQINYVLTSRFTPERGFIIVVCNIRYRNGLCSTGIQNVS